jgi:hypothetical protein
MIEQLINTLKNNPAAAYMSSMIASSAGLLNLFAHVQAVLGIVSLMLGIFLAGATIWIKWPSYVRRWKGEK